MGERAKILVVDDDRVVRQSYQRSLSGVHCSVRAALNAQEALKLMEDDPSDVVLVDIRMPGMDGIALIGKIKERWPESEVVVITGYPSVESAKEAVRLGAYNYLAKPVGPEEVIHAATEAVNRKRWSLKKDVSNPGNADFDYRFPWEN